jgi:FMN phosphatase YigB (HAD superfamily)
VTGILFDLDLTLVEYDPAVPGIFRRGSRRVGLDPGDPLFERFLDRYDERFRALDGNPFEGAAADVADEFDLTVDPRQWATALVETERAAAWVHDDVRRTVERLADDHPVGVVTQGWGSVQRAKLRTVGLAEHVDAVVTPGDVGAFKPDPALVRAGADRLAAASGATFDPRNVLVVGDSVENDVVPGNEAGYRTVLYRGSDERADACLAGRGEFGRLLALA